VDVARAESVEELAERSFGEMGGAHILCNNAGVIVGGTLEAATEDDWRWALSVNLGGVINGCRAFVPRLREQGQGGHIVNTASVGGFLSAPGLGVYCTTKFAVVGFSDALRMELAPDRIGVSVLCPGNVRTNLLEADRNRPPEWSHSGGRADSLQPAIDAGVDPVDLGDPVLRGIRSQAPYIFTHADYRDPFERRFRAVLAAFDG
jgi:NAD(P)-dependent dehydrogenase (short-subunit alcohol dehydrogenase family)